ncbi:MAG: T9SS type A sorting domain-containing protein [Bacteroidales bacterium]|jgi:hypothetical protein|nr:T9SS type A sorting domain-containing protein [Bacteroidales bacterium]
MRKYIFLAVGMLMIISGIYSQRVTFTENFDGNTINFTASPSHVWEKDTNYYVSPPAAYLGMVPNMVGDVTFLETRVYDFSAYTNVLLRFKHICKISPMDVVRVEYKISNQGWKEIPAESYLGKFFLYGTKGFSAASYPDWQESDSLALPQSWWWKEESFDMSFEVQGDNAVQFRFVIEHGTVAGTQISYGWLLDDIEIIASGYAIGLPIVEFMAPLVQGTIYSTGPYTIKAKVKTQSSSPIQTPYLVYTATLNGVSVTNSVQMTSVASDSVWEGIIPQFVLGTTVNYSITGKDIQGNYTSASSSYTIAKNSHNYGNHSVALTAVNSPLRGQAIGGVSTPVVITIRNRGDSALTSLDIYRSVNGVVTTRQWTGNLSWDMEDTVHLGTYIPRPGMYDTIVVWVSNPNNNTDPVLNDDISNILSYGCSPTMSGVYTVGTGGLLASVNDFLTLLKYCIPTGDITLLLQTGVYRENWDLTNLSDFMGNHTLTITSVAANADSVVIKPTSGVGVRLANSNHLVIKAITVDATTDATTTGTFAIEFFDPCTNVTIRDCKLLTNPTRVGLVLNRFYYAPIFKGTLTGVIDSIFIINNVLDGGYYGVYIEGEGPSSYNKHIVCDSNMISNQYEEAICFYCTDLTSCSYNKILSRERNIKSSWCGVYLKYANGPVVGNHIKQRTTAITGPCGIFLDDYHSNNTTDTGLVANNEIILNSTSGIYTYSYTKAKILHNSISISGSGTASANGIYIYDDVNNYMVVKNNNIMMGSSNAYPIYVSATTYLSQYDIDYNNMYAPTNVGYAGAAKTTMAAWQQTVTTDNNSVSVHPGFIDSTVSLELRDYTDIPCNILSDVDRDINNRFRVGAYTGMGCYHPYKKNIALKTIIGWRGGVILGETDSIKIQLRNTGTDSTITSFVLNWSINEIMQTGLTWTGSLAVGDNLNLGLGTITYTGGAYTIKAWISAVNGSQDESVKDDTLSVSAYVCGLSFSGTHIIGSTGTFPSWEAALEQASLCAIDGDVTFEFQPGTYTPIDLSLKSSIFGAHTLTLTSTTHQATDVVFQTAAVGITLNNSNNIIIKDITIDATAGTYAIQFTGACANVTIRDCKLLANPTTSNNAVGSNSYAIIYKASSTGIADSIFMINNLLDGGYYGIYLQGVNASSYNKHIVFDSNTVSNQYYYATVFSYTDLTSCSYNNILSRTKNASNGYWNGMTFSYVNGPITGNYIKQCTTAITSPRGISLSYYHSNNTTDTGLVSNNEIILNVTGTIYNGAIDASNGSKARILHNSIYVSGTGAARGINILNNVNNYMVIKNNNIVMESPTAYPIYLNNISNVSLYDMDYNNMYAPTYVGDAGGAKITMTDWQQTITTDKHSVSVRPKFINNRLNLELVNYNDFGCNLLSEVLTDKEAAVRGSFTAMGCYRGFAIYPINAALNDIQAESGLVLGTNNTVKAVLINLGTMPLTHATFNWSFNGVTQSASSLTWSGNLALGEKDTVDLGTITYAPAGYYTIKAWIDNLGSQQDMFSGDDTTEYTAYICSSMMSGIYTIGATGTFKTYEDALERMNICSISGDVTLAFEPGTYNEDIDLKDISLLMGVHTLTFTSTTHNATDVVFRTEGAGITLNNSNNIIIKDITIDATAGTYAIQFTGSCTNVTIRDCKLLADPTVTSSSSGSPIFKGSTTGIAPTGIADSIFIINNLLDGGYDGISFIGGTSASFGQQHIVFDSNTVSNQYRYATYFNYADLTSCSYNTILSRTTNTYTSWHGISLSSVRGNFITGNYIKQCTTAITGSRGIYLSSYSSATDTALIANNEIISSAGGGIYATGTVKAKLLHNSIYISGSGASSGINITHSNNNYMVIKNNNIIMESSTAYPISLSSTANVSLYDMDYNNIYAPTYAGYVGTAKTTMQDWQQTITTDKNSIRVRPGFIDSTLNLKLVNYNGLECNPFSEVPTDKEAAVRGWITAMGCYNGFPVYPINAMLNDIQAASGLVLGTSNTVKVILTNVGTTPLTHATLNWSFNGVIQSQTGVSWTGNLAFREKDTVDLGMLTYAPAGYYTIKAWIHDLESQQDMYSKDDTTAYRTYICPSTISGTYTIGATGASFETFEDALYAMNLCGISGDVTLAFAPGTYNEKIDLTDISLLMGAYTLTLTSTTHQATNVVIKTTEVGITLNKSNNIIIKDITIDATAGTYAIQFTDACTNVTIRDCRLLANSTAATSGSGPISGSSGTADSIFIINNLLDGGFYGISFRDGKHIVFDSNTLNNQYNKAATFTRTDFTSCSYNTILINTLHASGYWGGMSFSSVNGPIIGNRIEQCGVYIMEPRGISLNNYNYTNTTDTGLVANNVIILKTLWDDGAYDGETSAAGIFITGNINAKILHNSIHISGLGAFVRGINLFSTNTGYMIIKNNNIMMTTGIPIVSSIITNFSLCDMDYNNMYGPGSVARYGDMYSGTAIGTIEKWQQIVTTDKHSVRVAPVLSPAPLESCISVRLSNPDLTPFQCPFMLEVPRDIESTVRRTTTLMGAYTNPSDIVTLAQIVAPVADTVHSLSFDLYAIIKEETGALIATPVPKITIQTTTSTGTVSYDTVTMQYNSITDLWKAEIPQQYYGSTVSCSLFVSDTAGNSILLTKNVYLEFASGGETYTGYDLGIISLNGLTGQDVLCPPDYVPLSVTIANAGTQDYDFTTNPMSLHLQLTTPNPFSLDTIIRIGSLISGQDQIINLADMFPVYAAGQYDFKVWLENQMDTIAIDDTLLVYYVSGRFALPIDKDFSGDIPVEFTNKDNNTFSTWEVTPQGIGADTAVKPVFGTDMLSFIGSRGAMTTLSTRQLDLSHTVQPSLSFWYFHDTIPSKDYTDVRLTVDGGSTYTTLFSLLKYNPVYGWKQYDIDLPIFAINQCVVIVFEAMEKSLQANVTQYIDRIRITAKQDIAMSEIILPQPDICGLKNNEIKVVMSNFNDVALDYTTTPTIVTLEVKETGQIFEDTLTSGSLLGFSSDTVTVAKGFDFNKGTYTFKAYFSSVFDIDRQNDTLVIQPVAINPALSVDIYPESSPANCLTGEWVVNPTVTLYNTGNMDLSNIDLILQIDTGENNPAVYVLFKETYTSTILAGDTATYMFNNSYTVPWNARYYVRAYVYLSCDSALVHNTIMITECVNITDLRVISIVNPYEAKDTVGNSIQVTATLNNLSDYNDFPDARITVVVENSLREEIESFTETQTVGISATVSHTFTTSYTVPDDSVYYLTVFVDSYDNYSYNDTMTIRRETVERPDEPEPPAVKRIDGMEGFTLGQNIPNPANNSTLINYSIPEAGEVTFKLHSVSGQLLYSKTIEVAHGKQSLELNTSSFAAGIYFYSIEYKGQRLVKRMMISD